MKTVLDILNTLLQPPLSFLPALILSFLAVGFSLRGVRLLSQGWRSSTDLSGPLHVIRAIRCGILTITMIGWAAGFFSGQKWPLIIGAFFLAEEIYETGLIIFIIRFGQKRL
jgi:hypothetical protein